MSTCAGIQSRASRSARLGGVNSALTGVPYVFNVLRSGVLSQIPWAFGRRGDRRRLSGRPAFCGVHCRTATLVPSTGDNCKSDGASALDRGPGALDAITDRVVFDCVGRGVEP